MESKHPASSVRARSTQKRVEVYSCDVRSRGLRNCPNDCSAAAHWLNALRWMIFFIGWAVPGSPETQTEYSLIAALKRARRMDGGDFDGGDFDGPRKRNSRVL